MWEKPWERSQEHRILLRQAGIPMSPRDSKDHDREPHGDDHVPPRIPGIVQLAHTLSHRPGSAHGRVQEGTAWTVSSATEEGLISVARHLYNDGTLQLRRPGQRDAMLAVLGPQPPEQIVVVLDTGSGKTLIVMVVASLVGAVTTVVIVSAEAACTERFLDRPE
ncbi:hypothetical protein MRS44_018589 [Fusarium solani]|uniref:uncharacterized protein n=1 Tax=Fusarium solani TaxID=169388 RepID=UPI0032C48AAE|nr:hypothetical protein MRS44_018589 [Fusarium solani]